MEPGTTRGIRSLAKMWGVSRTTAQYKVNSEGWTKVNDPHEVGSMKASVNVWRKD
jgi:hypothetical protein